MTIHRAWLVSVALSWCLLVSPAAAGEAVKLTEIRQNLFSTCSFEDGQRWIVGELGRVFSTADNGKTLTRWLTNTRTALLAVDCLDDGTLIIVGQNGLGLRSRDRGKSWEPLSMGTERNLLSVAFATAQIGVAIGDYGTLLRTEDGGTTWTLLALPEDVPLPEDIAEIIRPGDILLYDIEFADAENGWIVGEFGVIFSTGDGGETWVSQSSPVETTLFGVCFPNPQEGWAAGLEEVLIRTSDGGNTWRRQKVPSRKGFVLAIYSVAVQVDIGWAVGDSGLLLRSTDGGNAWTRVALPIQLSANWLRDIDLTPDKHGLIVGSDGLIITTNGELYNKLGP